MMRKTAKTIVLLTMIFVMAISVGMMAMGCEIGGGGDGNSSSKTIYYQYNDNVKNHNDWICFEKDKWSDSENTGGRLEKNGDKFRAYLTIFGEEDVMFYGTVSNGVLKWTLGESFGMTIYYKYYSDDCTVSNKDSRGIPETGDGTGDGGQQPSEDNRTKYTVTFNSMGGSSVASVEVRDGDRLTAPTQPTKSMSVFSGWYKDIGCLSVFDFETERITSNITLYAKWKKEEVRITSCEGATIESNNVINMVVSHDTNRVDMSGKIVINSNDAYWKLYYDELGEQEIPTKLATGKDSTLSEGLNEFYIVVTSADQTQTKLYKLQIYKKYTVTIRVFGLNTVTPMGTMSAVTGDIMPTPNYTIPGYTITGWSCSEARLGEKIRLDSPRVINVYAQYTPNEYTVTYDANNGTMSERSVKVTYGKETQFAVPTRVGYTFMGWYRNDNQVTGQNAKGTWNYADDGTLTAVWRANRYSVKTEANIAEAGIAKVLSDVEEVNVYFDLNGVTTTNGEVAMQTITKTQGLVYPTTPTANGKIFGGWFTDEDCTDYFDFSSNLGCDTTLYAKWYNISSGGTIIEQGQSDASYSVSGSTKYLYWLATNSCDYSVYYKNSNSSSNYAIYLKVYDVTDSTTVKNEFKISNTSYSAYNFSATAGHVYRIDYYAYYYNTTLYSYVTQAEATPEGGKVDSANVAIGMYGDRITLQATTNDGYTFVGWYDGSTKIADTSTATITMPASNKTYTAKWTSYTITTGTNMSGAGTYTIKNQEKVTVGKSVTLTATTNDGYTWLGWYDGNTKLTGELSYTFTMTANNKTYTAKWSKVTLDRNNTSAGSISSLDSTYKVGDSVTITATTNNKYTWIGWFDGDAKLTDELSYTFTMPASSKTYTAKWCKVTLDVNDNNAGTVELLENQNTITQSTTIHFNSQGGSAVADVVLQNGEAFTYPSIPTKSGYVFAGWYGNARCSGNPYTFNNFDSASVTVYAKWIAYSGAGVLNPNSSQSLFLYSISNSTVNYYAFVPLVSESIAIYTTGSLDTYGYLYDANKTKIASDDSGYDRKNFLIVYTVTAGQLYYIRPCGYSSSGNATVEVKAQLPQYQNVSITNSYFVVGDSATITATTKNGYTWVGWFDGDTKLTDELSYTFAMTAENKTYTAKWSNCPVTLTKNIVEAGSVSGLEGATAVGKSATITATTNNGYTWIGWYDGETLLTDELSYTFAMTADNKNYTAKWTYYTISTDTNLSEAGTYTIKDQEKVTVGKSVTITAATNYGYTWMGWYDGDTKLTDELSYTFAMPADSKTYTAKWTYYTVTTNANMSGAGTYTIKNQEKVTAGNSVTLEATTNNGYTWLGWYDGDAKLTGELSYTFTMTASSKTYTAKWMECPVTLIKNIAAAGSVSGVEGITAVGKSATITATTNAGYTWVGWYDGDTKLTDELSYTFTMTAENKTYTAKWMECPVALTKNIAEAGSVSGVEGATAVGKSATITATTNAGYTWVGWFDGDTKLTDETSYIITVTADNKTYTAKWSKVTLDRNDTSAGTVGGLTTAYRVGDSATITATTNVGYTWVGWFDGETLLTDELSYTFAMTADNKNYTAKWTYYTISTDTNLSEAGTYTIKNQEKVAVGVSVTLEATTNLGNTWVGWFDGETKLTDELSYTFTMSAENKTYTAKWNISEEMSNFNFTSTPTTCSISSVNNKNVTQIVVPEYVTSIGSSAFSGCGSLESMTIPFVGDKARKTEYDTYQYPFGYIFGTTSYTGGVATVQGYYGSSTSSTTSSTYYIPSSLKSVTVIGGNILYGAFYNCSSLTSITIGNGVTSIGEYAFYKCSSLTSITIPSSVTSIRNDVVNANIFSGCSALTNMVVQSGNARYHSGGNCIIETATKTMIAGCKTSIIPTDGSVTQIANYIFRNCSGLTSITIPRGVVYLGIGAFSGCGNLTSVTIQSGFTYIYDGTFSGCSGLTSITIPNGVGSIGAYAFSGCSGLTSITIPYSVKIIEDKAFSGCSKLTSITIPDQVKRIDNGTFYGCYKLTSITIPSLVTDIGVDAFYECYGLTDINFKGTQAKWNAISKGSNWNYNTGTYTIYCTDGNIAKD